jgi:MoaA/NifB/PqqE/SkfB family radical SAM enzyme
MPFDTLPKGLARRRTWFLDHLTVPKLWNLTVATVEYLLKSERKRSYPIAVKVDITPRCHLRCTVCVHASPSPTSNTELKAQRFDRRQLMTVEQFQRIVDELAGRTLALSMYYLGDPLVHPELDEMCRRASKAGLNTHVSTSLSFELGDDRIRSIVESGLTHLTVCVDGLRQETYERTRIGGRIALVLDNLERLLQARRALGRVYPKVEAQYVKYQHNLAELKEARRRLEAMGVDRFTCIWGLLDNYTDFVPGKFRVGAPRRSEPLAQCYWPHLMLQIKHDGDVIPCCSFRQGLQYTDSSEKRVVGNVFRQSVAEVWNSPAYRQLRRFVSSPRRVRDEPALTRTFCEGCPSLYETDVASIELRADRHHWDEVYERDALGRVVRKPETERHRVEREEPAPLVLTH